MKIIHYNFLDSEIKINVLSVYFETLGTLKLYTHRFLAEQNCLENLHCMGKDEIITIDGELDRKRFKTIAFQMKSSLYIFCCV